jgi:hypothetical protein
MRSPGKGFAARLVRFTQRSYKTQAASLTFVKLTADS